MLRFKIFDLAPAKWQDALVMHQASGRNFGTAAMLAFGVLAGGYRDLPAEESASSGSNTPLLQADRSGKEPDSKVLVDPMSADVTLFNGQFPTGAVSKDTATENALYFRAKSLFTLGIVSDGVHGHQGSLTGVVKNPATGAQIKFNLSGFEDRAGLANAFCLAAAFLEVSPEIPVVIEQIQATRAAGRLIVHYDKSRSRQCMTTLELGGKDWDMLTTEVRGLLK